MAAVLGLEDAAGYPRESRLPRGYQPPPATPLVARRPDGEAIDWESFDPLEDAATRDLIAGGELRAGSSEPGPGGHGELPAA